MALVWNNIDTFRRHLEDMKIFRQTHPDVPPPEALKLLKAVPIPFDNISPGGTGIIKSLTDARGKTIIVPIWKTTLPRGVQN